MARPGTPPDTKPAVGERRPSRYMDKSTVSVQEESRVVRMGVGLAREKAGEVGFRMLRGRVEDGLVRMLPVEGTRARRR